MAARRRRQAPLIGVTCEALSKRKDFADYGLYCDHRYAAALKDAGGHPVLLPIAKRARVMRRYLEGIEGLVIVGGDDVDPRLYGERPGRRTKVNYGPRTAFEAWLYRAGKRRRLPILGICHGMQLVNVLEGGSLHQDLAPPRRGPKVDHRGKGGGRSHPVLVAPGTRLKRLLGVPRLAAPTEHHQAVKIVAPGLRAAAYAEDGVIEAVEDPRRPELFLVQWHPERAPKSLVTKRLFKAFVRSCARYAAR